MDYNNMNRRASRSAYNYDDDRNTSRRRNDKVRRKEENADFQDFRRKPQPRSAAEMNRGAANSAPRNRHPSAQPQYRQGMQNGEQGQMRGQPQQNMQGRATQRPQPSRKRPPQPEGASRRPVGNNGQVKKSGQNQRRPVKPPVNNSGKAKDQQARQREWVYPEGYTPPRPNHDPRRRPENNRNPQRRPASRRKEPPKPRIDWHRIGVVVGAVAIRFLCCLIVVAIVYAIIYRNTFFSVTEPETKTVVYGFETVTGEGEEQKVSVYKLEADAIYAYDREELLVNFSEISKWLGCAQVGDVYSMRFVLGGETGSENVVFHNSSQNAFVNGAPVVMKSSARFDNGEVWVPVSFVTDYVTGIEIRLSKGEVTLGRNENELALTLRPSDPMTPAEQPEEE